MIRLILIFQQQSGELLYSYSLQEEIKIDLFSTIISAITKFTNESFNGENSSLKNIQIGEYLIYVYQIYENSLNVVFICDHNDEKIINKIIPDISQIFLDFKELFSSDIGDLEQLQHFTFKLSAIIASVSKTILNEEIPLTQEAINKTLLNYKGTIITNLKQKFEKIENKLILLYENEDNVIKKKQILNKICNIKKKLADEESYKEWNEELNKILNIIKDQEVRLNYYLKKIEEALKSEDFKSIYPFLYSFCEKLQHFGKKSLIKKYRQIAEILIDERKVSEDEILYARKEIAKISFNLQDFYPDEKL
ncbi:MAG: hypothetical protein JXA99_06920 [Candidatus Lokiarchaeota archaeon]|nr:hypothetical protein [Candidatus Lokiarchaeota archaeon]